MSDDLVRRARHNALSDMPHYASVQLIEALADRIEQLAAINEELEAKLADAEYFLEMHPAYSDADCRILIKKALAKIVVGVKH